MARKQAGTPALDVLTAAGVSFTTHEYEHSVTRHFGDETVSVLGVPAGRVFKTLIASVTGAGKPELVVGVVPVSGQLDLKSLAAAVGAKRADMADPAAAQRSSGYVVGGISPFGQRTRLRTVVDTSAMTHPTVLVSGGRRGLQVELDPADLVRLTDALVADIGRD
ncbi:MAG TPA: Cys-tRNA(Pro) deacylase [Propionibacteriaceae bacterium]|nr:Cys-tRNA(Pro) deacylase [Propionibacteriaceae bacterium]